MALTPLVILVGVAVGVAYGVFGAGGSAFATPILALLGVPPVFAVASPLPATIPAAGAGAWSYWRSGDLDIGVAKRAILAGAPAAVIGAICSRLVSGRVLLVLSALVLIGLGARLAISGAADAAAAAGINPSPAVDGWVLSLFCAAVGLATGLLANSGGFLLVPVFLLVVRLDMRAAAATSLVVAAALSIPSAITHAALGDINWVVAGLFGIGLVPGSIAGSRLAQRLPARGTQRVFGVLLVGFGVWFFARLLLAP